MQPQNYVYGLIGKSLSHSFSKSFFEKKFDREQIANCTYNLFELQSIRAFKDLIRNQKIAGLNVTIPYKQEIIPFINALSPEAKAIGAVNCIDFKNGKLIGHNTDAFGFKNSLLPFLNPSINNALVLGNGGATKAVKYVLTQLNIDFTIVSRTPTSNELSYDSLTEVDIKNNLLIINTTPLGMFPNKKSSPNIPYSFLTPNHILYDLVYNPTETMFLKHGKVKNCATKNGLEMLKLQAEKSWEIWHNG